MPLPVPTLPDPFAVVGGLNDSLVKDEKLPLSGIVARSGWTGQDAEVARAVAMAESGGRPTAVSWTGCCIGLWQINAEVHNGRFGLPADIADAKKALRDPLLNGRVGYALWSEAGGWGPWDAHKNGGYRRYLNPKGHDPLITVDKGSLVGSPVEAVKDAVGVITSPIEAAAKSVELAGQVVSALFNPSTYMRIGKGWLGGVLLMTGAGALVFIVANKTGAVDAAEGAVKETAKVVALKKP